MTTLRIHEIDRSKEAVYKFLNQVPIFDKLSREDLYILLPFMGYTILKKDEILFNEGDAANYVFFVAKGCLDVIKSIGGDDKVVITTLRKGKSVGEMSILDEMRRSATIKARTDSTLLLIGKISFEKVLQNHPQLGLKVVTGIALLLSYNHRKTSSRLADYMMPVY